MKTKKPTQPRGPAKQSNDKTVKPDKNVNQAAKNDK